MPTPTEVAAAVLPVIPAVPGASSDPAMQALAWLAGAVCLILAIGKPIRDYLRADKATEVAHQVAEARGEAESFLYTHLAEQIKEQREIAARAISEAQELTRRIAQLERHSETVEHQAQLLEALRRRMEEKDAQMASLLSQAADERNQFINIMQLKDQEITRRDRRIADLDRRQHELEQRLSQDERQISDMTRTFCPECEHCQETSPTTPVDDSIED